MPLEVEILPMPFWMSLCFRGNRLRRSRGRVPCRTGRDEGQATVEAAVLIPALFTALLLLLQPGILLYDRMVMQGAAAEGCRLLATKTAALGDMDGSCEAFVRHRLGDRKSVV